MCFLFRAKKKWDQCVTDVAFRVCSQTFGLYISFIFDIQDEAFYSVKNHKSKIFTSLVLLSNGYNYLCYYYYYYFPPHHYNYSCFIVIIIIFIIIIIIILIISIFIFSTDCYELSQCDNDIFGVDLSHYTIKSWILNSPAYYLDEKCL